METVQDYEDHDGVTFTAFGLTLTPKTSCIQGYVWYICFRNASGLLAYTITAMKYEVQYEVIRILRWFNK